MYTNITSVSKSSSRSCHFISFSCLITLARTISKIEIEMVRVDILLMVLILGRKHSVFQHLILFRYTFFIDAFYQVEEIPFIPSLL